MTKEHGATNCKKISLHRTLILFVFNLRIKTPTEHEDICGPEYFQQPHSFNARAHLNTRKLARRQKISTCLVNFRRI